MTEIVELVQKLETDAVIELFQLDATGYGDSVYYFCSTQKNGAAIVFDGNTYTPIPIEATGFETAGISSTVEPRLRISNIDGSIGALAVSYNDLVGCPVKRLRTFARYLDDGSEPDPTALLSEQTFIINKKTARNQIYIEWALALSLNYDISYIPSRQIIRDICRNTYRRYVDGDFDYTGVTCPYTDTAMFTRTGASTVDPYLDSCGRHLSDCVLRYGTAPLPFRAFPGCGRTRT
jgi:lambda family phage minor tail protein L